MPATVTTPAIVLRVENLTKRYGDLIAVDDLSLTVYEGEVFGFLGPNGAGKTTSINMICGLLEPDAGRVLIHGERVRGGDADTIIRVGVCPQQIVLWERLTCLEQLIFMGEMYGMKRRIARQRGNMLLDSMGLSEKRDKLARTLSGGMQRRLNLIMALVHDPDIIVLDEPEAGLDPQSRVMVREYIQTLAHDKTVILTTHNMDEAERLADRVAIIDHGRLLRVDTPEALKHQIGEGDVLEIMLKDVCGDSALAQATSAIRLLVPDITAAVDTLILRAPGIVEAIPGVLDILGTAGITPGDIRLRENSLEDVFIALTGRRLRE